MANSKIPDSEAYYLDEFQKKVGKFLIDHIIPVIKRKNDTIEIQKRWGADLGFVVVSGILIKLAKRYPKDVNEFWEQAEDLLRDYCKADLINNPSDNLLKRYPRWFDKFKELPQYPPKRRSSETGDRKPDRLYALLVYELSIENSKTIFENKDKIDDEKLIREIRERFPNLSKKEAAEYALNSIRPAAKNNEVIRDIALLIIAKSFGVSEETFKRHYLGGARKEAKEIDAALKYR